MSHPPLGPQLEADLAENLMVDGDWWMETYGCVKSFCYLGDTERTHTRHRDGHQRESKCNA